MVGESIAAFLTLCLVLTDVVIAKDVSEDFVNELQPLLVHLPMKAAGVTKGNVVISHVFSTTSSMGIRYGFFNYTPSGSIEAIFVGWDLKYGRFVSNKLDNLDEIFEFTHLQSDTSYQICVEILERVSGDLISHVDCTQFSTIAPMRVDSIIVLLLVLGYFILMPVLGCVLWRRKLTQLGGGGSSGHSLGENYGHDKKVMRWKDIEERLVLNSDGQA